MKVVSVGSQPAPHALVASSLGGGAGGRRCTVSRARGVRAAPAEVRGSSLGLKKELPSRLCEGRRGEDAPAGLSCLPAGTVLKPRRVRTDSLDKR